MPVAIGGKGPESSRDDPRKVVGVMESEPVPNAPTLGEMTAELLARHDRPGPRYTSYPTAIEFHDGFGPADHGACLDDAAGRPDDPLSLYVHLPFCEHRCSFCACHVVVTQTDSVAEAYLSRLVAEARLTGEKLGDRRVLQQYHWGGGTPTYYSPTTLAELHHSLLSEFELAPGAEVALEVDPRVTTAEHLTVLREVGFNRVSMGVQDTDDRVQGLMNAYRAAIGTGAAWRLHGLGQSETEATDWLREQALTGGEGWVLNRMKFIAAPPRAVLIWSYWWGEQSVAAAFQSVRSEDEPEFIDYLYGRMHSTKTVAMFQGGANGLG